MILKYIFDRVVVLIGLLVLCTVLGKKMEYVGGSDLMVHDSRLVVDFKGLMRFDYYDTRRTFG